MPWLRGVSKEGLAAPGLRGVSKEGLAAPGLRGVSKEGLVAPGLRGVSRMTAGMRNRESADALRLPRLGTHESRS